ncbi:MAG TPA: hypothetical protein VHG28_07235 [Longimicrobiaceae bacterium]|nr:hypothetical protein [Longimicrobiaceae bacterium]
MRAIRLTLTALACALLAGCGTDDIVTPEMDARFTDTDCTDGVCGDPAPPSYDWGSDVNITTDWGDGGQNDYYAVYTGRSWTIINDGNVYSSGRVDAVAYTYGGCLSINKREYYRGSKTVYGAGWAEVRARLESYNKYGFQMVATHRITARPGYYGGGTFYSESSECNNGG